MRPLTSFKATLAYTIKKAREGDELTLRFLRDGDAAHLQRWVDNCDVDTIWQAIRPGPFNFEEAFNFMMINLRFRKLAESCDELNETIGSLQRRGKKLAPRERKRAAKMLAHGEMSADEFAAILASVEDHGDARTSINLDPLLTVRSDENGTRKRTLFCRMLSSKLHDAKGRWHDAEVQALCQIAFDCDDVTIDMARSARRESTRRKRRR